MEEKKNRIYKTIMMVILTAFVTFMITSLWMYSYYGETPLKVIVSAGSETDSDTKSNLEKSIKKVKYMIDKCYLWNGNIDENKLEQGAIKGYVEALGDEYTEYVPASDADEYTESLLGNFVGIGIYMIKDETKERVLVRNPIPGSPAEAVGIRAGDLIVSVDGKEFTIDDFEIISSYIKGEEGTSVNIVVERAGERLSFDVKREKIIVNPIITNLLDNDIGYLQITSFDEDTDKEFEEKALELQEKGAKKLIIDVRNNGGGIVKVAESIADSLLEKGKTIISTVDNKGKKETRYSEKDAKFTMPVVLLVNNGSASASEILACSLQDNNRAKIVGVKTFGKGVIQTYFTLADGSGLKITTEQYYTPNDKTINKEGITPDEVVELEKVVSNTTSENKINDTQLEKAIEILKGE